MKCREKEPPPQATPNRGEIPTATTSSVTVIFGEDGQVEDYRILAPDLGRQRLLEQWARLFCRLAKTLQEHGVECAA